MITRCGFPMYGRSERCEDVALESLDIEIEDKILSIPICKYHAETWDILIGEKGLAALIRDSKVKGEWKDA